MRKSVVLALVLVLALAGATFAATPQFSGTLEVKADSAGSFVGPFTLGHKFSLGLKFDEEGENWTANVGLAGQDLVSGGSTGNFVLDNYKATFQGTGFDVAVAHKQSVGAGLGDRFKFYGLSTHSSGDTNHRIRLNTKLVDQDVHFQLGTDTSELRARTQGETDAFNWGVTAGVDLSNTSQFGVVVDGGLSLGIVDVFAAAGSVGGTVWGVGADAQVTEQFSVDAEYKHDSTWKVGAEYEEGLLRTTATFNSANNATVGLIYRGDAGNQSFGDLFKDDKYYLNVAPAFGGSYATNGSKVTLNATAPLADNFAIRGKVEIASGNTDFEVKARYAVNDKFTISPYYDSADPKFGSDFNYAVGAGATIGVNLESKNNVASSSIKFTVKF